MGNIVWPLCIIFVFGSWYFVRRYEQEKSQMFKILCIAGLITSGFTLIVWGFALGMLAAGTVQSLINFAEYKKHPEKFAEQLEQSSEYFNIRLQDVLQLVLLIAILAVICIVAFRAMKSYFLILKTGTSDHYSFLNMDKRFGTGKKTAAPNQNKSAENNVTAAADTPKLQRVEVSFCPKCGARLGEGISVCPGCGRKPKNKK